MWLVWVSLRLPATSKGGNFATSGSLLSDVLFFVVHLQPLRPLPRRYNALPVPTRSSEALKLNVAILPHQSRRRPFFDAGKF